MLVEESNRIENTIVKQDSLRCVLCVRYRDFEFQVAAFALLFVLERMAVVIGDGERFEKQRLVEVLRRVVFDGNRAVDSVPETGEARFDDFRHFDSAIGIDGDGFVKALNCEIAALGRWRR